MSCSSINPKKVLKAIKKAKKLEENAKKLEEKINHTNIMIFVKSSIVLFPSILGSLNIGLLNIGSLNIGDDKDSEILLGVVLKLLLNYAKENDLYKKAAEKKNKKQMKKDKIQNERDTLLKNCYKDLCFIDSPEIVINSEIFRKGIVRVYNHFIGVVKGLSIYQPDEELEKIFEKANNQKTIESKIVVAKVLLESYLDELIEDIDSYDNYDNVDSYINEMD